MKEKAKSTLVPAVVLGVLGIAALAAWIYQMASGSDLSGSGNAVPWGLYIVAFMFCDGIATGAMFFAALPYLMGWKGYEGVSRIAALIAVVFMAVTGALVVADLGQPLRAFNMLVFGQFGSPLMWDMLSLSALIIVGIAFLVAQSKGNDRATKALGAIGVVLALVVTLVMASIFGVMGSHEAWNTPLLAPWFTASSVVSGAAALLLFVAFLEKAGCVDVPDGFFSRTGLIMGIAALADVLMLVFDVALNVFSGSGAGFESAMAMLSGPLAPIFWVEAVACVAVVVMMLSAKMRGRMPVVVLSSAIALVAMFCKRLDILESGYVASNLPAAVVQTGSHAAVDGTVTLAYMPSAFEVLVICGFVCLGAALVLFIHSMFASKRSA